MANVLIIDNYDSFAFNLAQAFGALGAGVTVVRNDAITIGEIVARAPTHICLSPGPKGPDEAGICVELIRRLHGRFPILGVCLGHQCIASAFGGTVKRVWPVHGKAATIAHDGAGIFRGVPNPMRAARYHSLAIEMPELPATLLPTAWLADGPPIAMAVRATDGATVGVQFHPESYLTPDGPALLANFLAMAIAPALLAVHAPSELAPPSPLLTVTKT